MDRLKAAYDTISALDKDQESLRLVEIEATRMVRVISVLREYVLECDDLHGEERAILPLSRLVSMSQQFSTCRISSNRDGQTPSNMRILPLKFVSCSCLRTTKCLMFSY